MLSNNIYNNSYNSYNSKSNSSNSLKYFSKSFDLVINELNIYLYQHNYNINDNNYIIIIEKCYKILLQIKNKSLDDIKLLFIMLFLEKTIILKNGNYIPLQYSLEEINYLGFDKYYISNNEIIDNKQLEYVNNIDYNNLEDNPLYIINNQLREKVYLLIYKIIENKNIYGGNKLNYKQRKIYEEQLYGINSIHNFLGNRKSSDIQIINNIQKSLINQFKKYETNGEIKKKINSYKNNINYNNCKYNNCNNKLSFNHSIKSNNISKIINIFLTNNNISVKNKNIINKLNNKNFNSTKITILKMLNSNQLYKKSGIELYLMYYLFKKSLYNNNICVKIDENPSNKTLFIKYILSYITNNINNYVIINDASSFQKINKDLIIKEKYKNHIYKNIYSKQFSINEYITIGQLLDSSNRVYTERNKKNKIYKKINRIYSLDLYNKIINDIFNNVKYNNNNIIFEINDNNNLNIKINNENIVFYLINKKNEIIYNFNEVRFINCVLKILNLTYDKPLNYFENLLNNKSKIINVLNKSLNKNKKNILLNDINNKNYNIFSYFELIKHLKILSFSKNDIISFILRFKILGDKLQAFEAKSLCYLKKIYNINDINILFKNRILTTDDRVLLGLCLFEGDISFISKITLNKKFILFFNFIN